jgi:hypothetical protein
VGDDVCFTLFENILERIFRIVGVTHVEKANVKGMTELLDRIFSFVDESIYAEFDYMARAFH